ncbi:MAG: hypothetical protein PHU94_04105 [Bacilli bacterium]|nr:hypothetical protein [Bacilli bacterium]MDD4734418.1 hypothetical protein [Bacilli bacterium]
MKKMRITKGERFLWLGTFLSLVLTILVQVFGGANIGHLNMSVEKIKYEIEVQTKTNESLTMKINELTSFDKIEQLVKDMGLTYKNENILIVDEQ